ncbi:hypothetical protein DCAR_0622918 [Daucus carota subsp. sativus]|uniref:Aluminum-activated malate transporter n=1 Tax=Daucus carota subsp. sativus TaxID=79200 RepID=A0A161ZSI6_DAUCS|nr:PREDICTED: aluminum-activated malate transporter 2-like [Daucus carota subsp. sativus]WOH03519.1 hypothetical protein DCAR_0622918 [Daucus carota subsp. sativus]
MADASEDYSFFGGAWSWLKALPLKVWSNIAHTASKAKELGQDDPRRIIHSCKVGLAITIVSLFYYFNPLYDGFGVSAMWAVLTVVVVFEFSVGATLGKGVNRAIATLVAGSLGVAAHHLAVLPGETAEPFVIGITVFLVASVFTFARFFPKLKARYDYGLVIFILTFCLISVSGYRDDEVIDLAHKRMSTIFIGGATSIFVCIFIYPAWAGDDLHKQLATNMEKLATFLQGFGDEFFKTSDSTIVEDRRASLQAYKSVLNSKGTEETLANFAKWEPRHGRFRYRHPWDQYLKVGAHIRQCAYSIEALNGYLNSDNQIPYEIREKVQQHCKKMSTECSLALKELALSIRTMTRSSAADAHVLNAKNAAKSLKSSLKTGLWVNAELLQIIPALTVASLLVEVVTCSVNLSEAVHELATLAHFKVTRASNHHQPRVIHRGTSNLSAHHAVTIDG